MLIGVAIGTSQQYRFAALDCAPMPAARAYSHREQPRAYRQLFRQPLLIAAIAAGSIGYGIMVLLMTATPLAMQQQEFPFPDITTVIQWHVLGMFVPSFFTGYLIRRFSSRTVILWGCWLLLLTYTYEPAEQGKVQGINEFLVFSAAAVGSLFAGQGMVAVGWTGLNLLSIPFILFVALVILRLRDERSRQREKKTANGQSAKSN